VLFEVKDKNGYSVFVVYQDSVQVFINASGSKTNKGCFAINPKAQSKNNNNTYFEVNIDTSAIINPSQNRILWYPTKSAFLTGKVLIESPDSIGTNSFASGYKSKAIGNQSQALGYQPIARGNYSTAIGYNAIAQGSNSYAFGNNAYSEDSASYAIGSGAKATGLRSFAIGSSGVDSAGTATNPTIASGDYSYAFGMGSQATQKGAFAFGTQDTASGLYSLAMGYKTKSKGWYATTMGYKTTANGVFSIATGNNSTASGWSCTALGEGTIASGPNSTAMGVGTIASGAYSMAMGSQTTASGDVSTAMGLITKASGTWSMATGILSIASGNVSTAMGYHVTAKPYASLVFGRYNDTTCISQTTWNASDPLFIIGNGSDDNNRSNAMTVLKNGNVGIGTTNPGAILDVVNGSQEFRLLTGTNTSGYTGQIGVNDDGINFSNNSTGRGFNFKNSNGTLATITASGNVGIGTTTPGEKLEINGNLKFSSGAPYISNGNNRYIMQCGWSGTWGDFTAINSAYDWNDVSEPGSIIASGGYPLVVTKGNSGTPFSTTLMTVNSSGNVSMPYAYSTIVGGTNRDLYIDNSGLIGYVSSSLRYKTNITEMENIDWLYNLRPVNYTYKNDSTNRKQYGLIAEEVEKLNPLFVSYNSDGSVETVSYSSFISPMLKAIQEQKKKIDEQQNEITELKNLLKAKDTNYDQLKAEIEKIKTQLNASVMK
jgi:polyhydroxyalkanoate synthesis regulator phasin